MTVYEGLEITKGVMFIFIMLTVGTVLLSFSQWITEKAKDLKNERELYKKTMEKELAKKE